MQRYTPEYYIERETQRTIFRFRCRSAHFERYFSDFRDDDALDTQALLKLAGEAKIDFGRAVVIGAEIQGDEIIIRTQILKPEEEEKFSAAFLDRLADFYEANEVHITRMFGSFVYLKRIDGELRAVHATPIPIKHCPLMKQLLTEIGGDTARELLDAVSGDDSETQTKLMCELINSVVIKGGYFDTSRPLNSCEANVLFGASETMSSAFKSGLLDAAVIVSNNLGTIITTDAANTQGAVKRMTGLFLTSPSRQIVRTAKSENIIPVFPHTATIDQLEGVKTAIALGYRRIAVSVAWQDNARWDEISKLAVNGVELYKFGLCSTGIGEKSARAMLRHADLIWSCASRVVREFIEPNSIVQVGLKIPVHIMTEKGWALSKNHLKVMAEERREDPDLFDTIIPGKGPGKPVILNDKDRFRVITKEDIKECTDCPHPCI